MSNNTEMQTMLDKIAQINKVDGFDPGVFAVEYTDLNTNEKRLRLPVIIQMAWFRLLYPKGRIAVKVEQGRDCFVATAKVYLDYKDPIEHYISEATASRGKSADAPSVSPREWAQTAAIGIALKNAGFGLQFNMAGEDFSSVAPDELGVDADDVSAFTESSMRRTVSQTGEKTKDVTPPVVELTPEQKLEAALKIPYPLPKHAGRTLGDVMHVEPSALKWLATKYTGDANISEAAKLICEYAAGQASA